ncbi:MAG: ATP-binding cassette domain-containing protein [Gammaproteobacteria bacterium]|nr:ATP-binding cassette domain-containing protein [Gammaproteobacteria bacterium]
MVANSNPVSASRLSKNIDAPAGRIDILQDVSLELVAGEAVAILGASGSGKSTLLGLLAGLDDASSGEIRLFGDDLAQLDEDGRAALRAGRVGFVFQSFQLLPGMTALENVMLPLELSGEPKPRPLAEAALSQVELSQRLHHYPSQLSGGEQQRVAIARAFATRPLLLFADEPTGSLDQATGGRISDLIFQLRNESGAALLLVTHDASLAARCDRRLLLQHGRLERAA